MQIAAELHRIGSETLHGELQGRRGSSQRKLTVEKKQCVQIDLRAGILDSRAVILLSRSGKTWRFIREENRPNENQLEVADRRRGSSSYRLVEEAIAKNIFPNRLAWVPEQPSVGAIVAFQSQDDFAIGQAALSYITEAMREGRIQHGYVLFVRRQGTAYALVRYATVDQIGRTRWEATARWEVGAFWWCRRN